MMFALTPYKKLYIFAALVISIGITFQNASANGTLAVPTFLQDWLDASLISANDDWSGVPSIIGYRGDALTAGIDTDPQTILAGDDAAPVVDVNANQTNPNTYTTGGVAEFEGVYQVVALQGSGTADAPYIKIFLNTTGMNNIHVTYNVRDIDGSADNAVQQVALHYRVGSSGNFTNIPAGYIADATTGPGLATLSTPVNVTLPSAANDQSHVELRIMTTNATGNDEWVGIDDISITANKAPTGFSLSPNSVLENKPIGTDVGTLTASDTAGDTHTFALVNSASCAGNGADNSNFTLVGNTLKTAAPFDYETKTSYVICVTVTDNNGLAFTGEHIVNIQDVSDETPVLVLYSSNTSPQNNSVVL
ncbi:MAG: cadherin repeat domain-containing protein, partial [Anaerolineales bacterium]|nr:cadherin repeat domain-containing protein [Anaerolineales bacterium]